MTYRITTQWTGGFTGDVAIAVTGSTVDGWTLAFRFANGQVLTNAWNATATQSGNQVTATDAGWNKHLGTTDWGFNANWSGTNTAPTAFTLNGVPCATA